MIDIHKPKIILFDSGRIDSYDNLQNSRRILNSVGCEPQQFYRPKVAATHLIGDIEGVIVTSYDAIASQRPRRQEFSGLSLIDKVIELELPLVIGVENPHYIPARYTSTEHDVTVVVTGTDLFASGIKGWLGSHSLAASVKPDISLAS
jgi:hypothetical protein